jgi:hypothetical protein
MGRTIRKARVETLDPIQNHLDLVSYCAFEGESRVGAYLLQEKPDAPPALVFGWRLLGIHSYTPDEELEQCYERLSRGLKDFPLSDSLMARSLIRPKDGARQAYLDSLIESAPCDELKFFLYGEKARIRELGERGLRAVKEDYLFATYYSESEKEASDWIERGLYWVQSHILSHFGAANSYEQEELERVFRSGAEAQAQWHSFLTNKLGLAVFPLSPEQMRDCAWEAFNDAPAPDGFPQLITYGSGGLKMEVWSETCPSTLLTAHHVPKADRAWVYHPASRTYSAVMTFLDKPYGWESVHDLLSYLFSLLESQGLKHVEVVSQIWRGDTRLARLSMEKLIRQSVSRDRSARAKHNVDVGANLNLEESVSAQASLIKGDVPFHAGVAIIVHASHPDELKKLCREVSNRYQAPAVVAREKEVAWEVWLQSLPITRSRLLQSFLANRTLSYLNSEVLAMLPLMATLSSSQEGVELIAQDSKIPAYLNVFEYEGRHAGFFASSRSGKSVAIGSVLTTALSLGMPVVAVDYPGTSGRSTFTDYTHYLGEIGDYFDVREHSFNIFDRADLSQIPHEKERRTRWQLYVGFLKETLVAMVLGGKAAAIDARLETEVKTVVSFAANAFFKNPEILRRYEAAEAAGAGSDVWLGESPTLDDFIERCTLEAVRSELPESFVMGEDALAQTLYFVKLQLSYWRNSEIGAAIGRPSTVKPDARLIVFALTALKEDESQIFALIAFTAAYSRSLEYPRCLFFIDESPILIKFKAIAKIVASLFANGSKSGIRVVLSAQAPDQLAVDPSIRGDILQNMHYRLLGRVERTAIASCTEILGIPEAMVVQCAKFEPDRAQGRTQWLFFDGSRYTFVNYYAPPVQLATLVNNTDEADVRAKLKTLFLENSFLALLKFAELYRSAYQTGRPIHHVYDEFIRTQS